MEMLQQVRDAGALSPSVLAVLGCIQRSLTRSRTCMVQTRLH
jgi:hypothetical protein